MAKVAFSKLVLKKKEEVKIITINGQEIEVKQYLPIEEKLALIGRVVTEAADGNSFANPVKNELWCNLEIIFNYTNLSFTDKQKEDGAKLYDLMEENGVIDMIINAIPEKEYDFILSGVEDFSNGIYTQMNSISGILARMEDEYGDLSQRAGDLLGQLATQDNVNKIESAYGLD